MEDLDHLNEERILRWNLSEFRNHLYDTSIILPSRGKDLILTAWYRVLPLEVDPTLIEHPAAQKTAAVFPSDNGGERDGQGLHPSEQRKRGREAVLGVSRTPWRRTPL